MLVELSVVEQRLAAVKEVLEGGATVVSVAGRYGVSRQTVHVWLRKYADAGLRGLVDESSVPLSCPHQMSPEVEVLIVELRRSNPGWGPRTIVHQLAAQGVDRVPGLSSVYRCLQRHGLIVPEARKRKRADYKRWERARSMELWQMDIVGGVMLADGSKVSIVSGIDDHSRFIISAHIVVRAQARPVCEALAKAMRLYGVPAQILTDNGKVFTNRFGRGTGEVLFDRICRENGVKHILTAPRSPTTTGKIERWHKTLRSEFLNGKVFADVVEAQARLDEWVAHYNTVRPHQGIGMVTPATRFALAGTGSPSPDLVVPPKVETSSDIGRPVATRKVGKRGLISFASTQYKVGRWLAGETVEVVCENGLVHIRHAGALIVTHARRHQAVSERKAMRRNAKPKPATPIPRPSPSAVSVTRKVDSGGCVSFAATSYRVGSKYKRRRVQVAVVGDTVEISVGAELIRKHPVRHDRTREHGALANPGGRSNRSNAA